MTCASSNAGTSNLGECGTFWTLSANWPLSLRAKTCRDMYRFTKNAYNATSRGPHGTGQRRKASSAGTTPPERLAIPAQKPSSRRHSYSTGHCPHRHAEESDLVKGGDELCAVIHSREGLVRHRLAQELSEHRGQKESQLQICGYAQIVTRTSHSGAHPSWTFQTSSRSLGILRRTSILSGSPIGVGLPSAAIHTSLALHQSFSA